MKENFFTKKMTQKSDAELQEIIGNKESYIDEARLAASWELEKRNIKVDKIEVDSETAKDPSNTSTSAESKTETPEELTEPVVVEPIESTYEQPTTLYSKKAIYGFSIFSSTIFGAAIMMYNLKILNQPKARIQVLVFAVLYMIFSVLVIEALQASTFTALVLNVTGAFILNEYYWNKFIGKTFKYEPKGLFQAISIAILVVVVIFVLLMLTMPAELPA